VSVRSKLNDENYLQIDAGLGVPAELLISVGLAPELGRGRHELATFTCSHCCQQLIVNPWRTRERAWCRSCDHYICDNCKADQVAKGGACKPMRFVIEEVAEAVDKGKSINTVDIPRILLP
jgi:hypothetical protein